MRKRYLIALMHTARNLLAAGDRDEAQDLLAIFWHIHQHAPASTRRRWRCGQ